MDQLDQFTPGAANANRLRKEHPDVDAMLTHVDEAIERLTHEVEGGHIELEHTRASHLAARTEEAKPDVARDPAKLAAAKKKTAQTRKAVGDVDSRQMERLQRKLNVEELGKGMRSVVAQSRDLIIVRAKVSRPDDGDWRAEIARLEAAWQAKRSKRADVRRGPVPADELLRPFRTRITTLMEQGRPDVTVHDGKLTVKFPTVPAPWDPSAFAGKEDLSPRTIDIEAILYRYHGADILNDVERAADEFYADIDPATIMTTAERRKLLRELDAEIDRAGRELAATIWAAIREGHDIDFPPDLPVRAVLGIA